MMNITADANREQFIRVADDEERRTSNVRKTTRRNNTEEKYKMTEH